MCSAFRLISVGTKKDFSDVKLVPRPKEGWGSSNYATLSHCWGGHVPARLTTENQLDFQQQIPYLELPLTFQHAILATRFLPLELNVHYIWIDALCILQDSKPDWNIEAPNMGRIYRDAVICFAATYGSTSKAGLFRGRDTLAIQPCLVSPGWDEQGRSFLCEDRKPIETMLIDSSLGQRAWVVQETHMSRRILHFSDQQVFWECARLVANESYPDGLIRESVPRIRKNFNVDEWTRYRVGPHKNDVPQAIAIWSNIVSEYSACHLTRGTDKLVAIGSLAAELQRKLQHTDTYIAGLWKSQLPASLVWEMYNSRTGPKDLRPTEYRAPSWSWASVDGMVSLPVGLQSKTLARVESIKVQYVENNISLGVVSAEMHIHGPIAAIEIIERTVPARKSQYAEVTAMFKPRGSSLENFKGSHLCRFDTKLDHLNCEELFALVIMEEPGSGLLLRRSVKTPHAFERCGCFHVWDASDLGILLGVAETTEFHGCSCLVDCDKYAREHSILLV